MCLLIRTVAFFAETGLSLYELRLCGMQASWHRRVDFQN
jgi:hypothetical protein